MNLAQHLDGRSAFHQKLREIQEDPGVRSLARRRAGDSDLADDVLQATFCAVAQVKNPERIEDLRAYFCRVLINEVQHLRGQLRATLVEDFESLAQAYQNKVSCHPAQPRPVDELTGTLVAGRAWLARLSAQRPDLASQVPGRSSDPDRYRSVVVDVAERVLCDILNEYISDADSDDALRGAYPEWFAAVGCEVDNLYQRFSRARKDVRALLKIVINRDELR